MLMLTFIALDYFIFAFVTATFLTAKWSSRQSNYMMDFLILFITAPIVLPFYFFMQIMDYVEPKFVQYIKAVKKLLKD